MKSIKHALTERYYTWEDAAQAAQSDPEINLQAQEGQDVYTPSTYEDEHQTFESWEEPPKGVDAASGAEESIKAESKPEKQAS